MKKVGIINIDGRAIGYGQTPYIIAAQIHISVFCPTDKALDLEQRIRKECMRLWFEELGKVTK